MEQEAQVTPVRKSMGAIFEAPQRKEMSVGRIVGVGERYSSSVPASPALYRPFPHVEAGQKLPGQRPWFRLRAGRRLQAREEEGGIAHERGCERECERGGDVTDAQAAATYTLGDGELSRASHSPEGCGVTRKGGSSIVLDGASYIERKLLRRSPRDYVLRQAYQSVKGRYALHWEELGTGQYGVIRRCMEIDSGKVYACKTIKKEYIKV